MTDLDTFRAETRAWLEANVPASMRQPMRGEGDANWGGRKADYSKNPDQKLYMDRMAARGWTVPDWPKGLWRRRPVPCRNQDPARGNGGAELP
jgi:acyl-CoA dehydrogenase